MRRDKGGELWKGRQECRLRKARDRGSREEDKRRADQESA